MKEASMKGVELSFTRDIKPASCYSPWVANSSLPPLSRLHGHSSSLIIGQTNQLVSRAQSISRCCWVVPIHGISSMFCGDSSQAAADSDDNTLDWTVELRIAIGMIKKYVRPTCGTARRWWQASCQRGRGNCGRSVWPVTRINIKIPT